MHTTVVTATVTTTPRRARRAGCQHHRRDVGDATRRFPQQRRHALNEASIVFHSNQQRWSARLEVAVRDARGVHGGDALSELARPAREHALVDRRGRRRAGHRA